MFEKLLEAITGLTTALIAHTAALGAEPPKAKGKAAAKETAPVAAAAVAQAAPAAAVAQTTPAAASTGATAQTAGEHMVRVANEISREAAVTILEKYGAKTFAGVKPEHYAAFQADCVVALTPAAAQVASGAAGLL